MVSSIFTHCLGATEVNNYFARPDGQCFSLDTSVKGAAPLSLLDSCHGGQIGPNPFWPFAPFRRLFYLPLCALIQKTRRFRNMSRADVDGNEKSPGGGDLESLISSRNFEAANLSSAFVKPG